MSSEYNNERLVTLQKNYRLAWTCYANEVESLQFAQANGDGEGLLISTRERVEAAAIEYRAARDEMALFLLDQVAFHPEYQAESEREPALAGCRAS